MSQQSLPDRFLTALEASAPGTLVSAVCAGIGDEGIGVELVDAWCVHQDGFAAAYYTLVPGDRRGPLDEEELNLRLESYLVHLEQRHIDVGVMDRTAACVAAGVNLTEVVARTTEGSPDFDEDFFHRDEIIQQRAIFVAEDRALNLAGKTAKKALSDGDEWKALTQATTYLKARSQRFNLPQRSRVYVDGVVHHKLIGAGIHAELQATEQRYLLPTFEVVESTP